MRSEVVSLWRSLVVAITDRSVKLSRGTGSGSTASAMQGLKQNINNVKVPRKTVKWTYSSQLGDVGDGGRRARVGALRWS